MSNKAWCMECAIKALREIGEYPSASKISHAIGRHTETLNGKECVIRREIFKRLGIKLKGGPYAKSQNEDCENSQEEKS